MKTAWFILFTLSLVTSGLAGEPTEPVAAIQRFTDFQQVNLQRLLAGDIISERGSLMDFPNGISAQSLFVVPAPAEETAKHLQVWDPAPHEVLKVFAFHSLSVPCTAQDFQLLNFKTSQASVRWLLKKTLSSTSLSAEFNLTRREATSLDSCIQKRTDPTLVADCWVKLLMDRAASFQQKGLAGVLPYEVGDDTTTPVLQLRSMLREQAGAALEFESILTKIGILGSKRDPTLVPFYYWSLFDADRHGTLNLGAVYRLAVGDRYQLADVEYYVNGSYYTAITLYEVFPIRLGDRAGSLVWRGDFLAAPRLAYTKGTERLAYGMIMVQDIKKEIHCMIEEATAKR